MVPFARTLLPFVLGVLLPNNARAQFAHWEFGFSLATGAHSQLYTCYLVKIFEEKVIAKEPVGGEQFILQAKGLIKSKANPEGKDLFRENGIELCSDATVSTVQEQIEDCDPFTVLWKLRFQEWPFDDGNASTFGSGWAEAPYGPSQRQQLLLCEFGMRDKMDIVHGAAAFSLLRSVRDESWVANYVNGL